MRLSRRHFLEAAGIAAAAPALDLAADDKHGSADRRHPFVVEHRISETEVIHEGLYVFDPAALGPPCGTVRLTVYSENEPDKGDARVVDQKVLQQITLDFAPL